MSRTVSAWLREGAARLSEAGIDVADARYLLSHVMQVPRDRLVLMGGESVSPEVAEKFETALVHRIARVPVSKITGTRNFWGRDFRVTKDVLDPRPETESLIAEALAGPVPSRLLDLGTGSGCIALTLLAEWPSARGVATDLSATALSVAQGNADRLGVSERVEFIRSDWFGNVRGVFDLVVSNPPYISDVEMADLSPEVLGHDPHMALTPGGDGLGPYRVLAREGQAYLSPKGRILCEIGWKQGQDVAALFGTHGWNDVRVLPDMDGRDRVISALRG